MKRSRILAAMLAVSLTAGAVLTGCSGEQAAESASEASSAVSSETSPASGSEASSETDSSSQSEASEGADSSSESQGEQSGFDAVFAQNPLDAAFTEQMDGAVTTQDMLSVASTFSGLWEDEVNHAYELLKNAVPADQKEDAEKEKEFWDTEKEARKNEAMDTITGDGTSASLEKAIVVMNLYKNQARSIYQIVYENGGEITYAYAPY